MYCLNRGRKPLQCCLSFLGKGTVTARSALIGFKLMYVNDLHVVNAHFQINAPYITKAPLYTVKKLLDARF